MPYWDDGSYNDNGGEYYDYPDEYWDELYGDGGGNDWWGNSSGAGQVGSTGSQWAGDSGNPYTDEYWNDIYQGGGIPDPATGQPTWNVTGYGDDSDYEGFNNAPPGSSPEQYGGGGGGGGTIPNFDVTGYGDDADYDFPSVPNPTPTPTGETTPFSDPDDPNRPTFSTDVWDPRQLYDLPTRPRSPLIPGVPNAPATPPTTRTLPPPVNTGLQTYFTPKPTTPTATPPIRDTAGPIRTPSPSPGPSAPNVTNNTTKNANAKQTNIISESFSNNMPGIASGSPAGNPETFDPQYIPQSQRTDATIGEAGPTENPYDYGEADSWKYTGPDAGARGTLAANDRISDKRPGGGLLRGIAGGLQGLTGLNVASPKAFGQSVLGLTGANRYLDMINQQNKKKNAPRF